MRCNFCGAELKPHSRFCLNCGQLVDPAVLAAAQPGTPQAPAASPAAAAASTLPPEPQAGADYPAPLHGYSVLLTFADGSAVIVDDDAVLGRKPQETADAEGLIGVPLVDPLKSSSRVHLRLFLTPQGVNVVDAGSGNGTSVEHAGARYDAKPHEPFWIEPGDRLWLGEVPIDVSLA
ncbi:FHA domain-containing protein [Galactobacter valiniphilus]|uniref:FHA domain-containing protein n=1 Tax=Galactobacter valiniphilus TaxID=2676122 RepID=A0A399JJY5_9MICC|nr:FHA domain-containing protein [Galactobacter valiniphilus]